MAQKFRGSERDYPKNVGFDNEAWKARQMSNIESNMAKQGFTQKSTLPSGQSQFTKPAGSNTAIGSSFGRMIGGGGGAGGGVPNMLGLQQASMMLADAAARRDRETMQFEFDLKERSKRASNFKDRNRYR